MSKFSDFFKRLKDSKFSKDLIITVIGQIIVLLVTFGINKIISITGSDGYFADFNIIKKLSAVVGYIILFALGIALPKYIPECIAREDKKGAAYYFITSLLIICIMAVLVIAVLVIFRNPLAKLFFGGKELAKYMVPTAFYSFSVALTSYVYSYYRAVERYYAYSISQIIVQVITFIPVLFLSEKLVWLLWVWTIAFSLFSLAILIKAFFRFKPELTNIDKRLILKSGKELLVYCTPRIPGEIVLFAFTLVPLIIVKNKFGNVESDYFAAIISVNAALASLFSFVGIILLPSVSNSLVKNDLRSVTKQILLIAAVFLVLSLLMIGFVFLFPKFIIKVLYSSDYYDAIPLMKIATVALLPNAFYLLFRNPLDAINKFPFNTVCLAVGFVLMIVIMSVSKTIEMCAWSFVIGYAVLGVLSVLAWLLCLFLRKRKQMKILNATEETPSEQEEEE